MPLTYSTFSCTALTLMLDCLKFSVLMNSGCYREKKLYLMKMPASISLSSHTMNKYITKQLDFLQILNSKKLSTGVLRIAASLSDKVTRWILDFWAKYRGRTHGLQKEMTALSAALSTFNVKCFLYITRFTQSEVQ